MSLYTKAVAVVGISGALFVSVNQPAIAKVNTYTCRFNYNVCKPQGRYAETTDCKYAVMGRQCPVLYEHYLIYNGMERFRIVKVEKLGPREERITYQVNE
ncbi:hypothetical protein ACS7SF_25350 (plasmid) [Ralstonia sp. 25C]|uniref:hypothetical protein n=1 Tax=Ralstonia sp. 25C TaxID=3447363 RepID=UPI003F753979